MRLPASTPIRCGDKAERRIKSCFLFMTLLFEQLNNYMEYSHFKETLQLLKSSTNPPVWSKSTVNPYVNKIVTTTANPKSLKPSPRPNPFQYYHHIYSLMSQMDSFPRRFPLKFMQTYLILLSFLTLISYLHPRVNLNNDFDKSFILSNTSHLLATYSPSQNNIHQSLRPEHWPKSPQTGYITQIWYVLQNKSVPNSTKLEKSITLAGSIEHWTFRQES